MKRYTMAEINAMLDEAEAEIAAGKGTPHEEVMREITPAAARLTLSLTRTEEATRTSKIRKMPAVTARQFVYFIIWKGRCLTLGVAEPPRFL